VIIERGTIRGRGGDSTGGIGGLTGGGGGNSTPGIFAGGTATGMLSSS
jgi:hypothetical protein